MTDKLHIKGLRFSHQYFPGSELTCLRPFLCWEENYIYILYIYIHQRNTSVLVYLMSLIDHLKCEHNHIFTQPSCVCNQIHVIRFKTTTFNVKQGLLGDSCAGI